MEWAAAKLALSRSIARSASAPVAVARRDSRSWDPVRASSYWQTVQPSSVQLLVPSCLSVGSSKSEDFRFISLASSLTYNHALSTLLLRGKLEVIHGIGLSVLGLGGLFFWGRIGGHAGGD